MEINSKKVFNILNPRRVWIPIALGLGIVFYLFYSNPDFTYENLIKITDAGILSVVFAFLVLLIRDWGYIYRIRTLTGKSLSWSSSWYVIILWEFASAVTPSVVGGTAVAIFILAREGINLGKSLAYVMLTAILDNLFFVVVAPVVLFAGSDVFPTVENAENQLGASLPYFFWLSYGLIALYTFIMFFGLFIKPRGFKWLLIKVTSIRFLRRWRFKAYERGNEMMWASSQLKGRTFIYWGKIIGLTIIIWCARYLMLNALMNGYVDLNFSDHLVIFSRQVIMWVTMLISPTPGSSGTAEFFFQTFFSSIAGSYTFVIMIFWRLMSYYPYLILGTIFLPRWIRRVYTKKK